MRWFFGRLPKVGDLPAALREELEREAIIVVAENVRVRQRFSGSVPGRHDAVGMSWNTGFFVCTRQRLYASIPTMRRLTQPVVDQAWDAAQHGPAKVVIDESGVVLTIDLRRVDARFHGEVSETFKTDLSADVLAALPKRALSFDVSPEYVFHSLGVRART
ncbi:hypothetical protein [Mycobacterium sp. URHB0044]|uniref:hypothetical protein n=1 Tax=Mycobacterium sp. URHB0044 TaxID=1380386 RepID=UPI00048CB4F3|nr:hypothetical protein [Mycobacterium sp. URHB0044]